MNNIIKVGDIVEFKSDVEQSGRITKIVGRNVYLESLTNEGFSGDYIGGNTTHVIDKKDIFSDDEKDQKDLFGRGPMVN